MINRDFLNHDVEENVKDFPNDALYRVIVQKQYPFDQNNCTSIQTIAPHFEQLHLTENNSNHGESGKISSSYTTEEAGKSLWKQGWKGMTKHRHI